MAANTQTLNTNPCGKCRALGRQTCQCSNSGGGDDHQEEQSPNASKTPIKPLMIANLPEPGQLPYELSETGDHALNNCTLTLALNKDLAPEDRQAYINRFLAEFNDFLDSCEAADGQRPNYKIEELNGKLILTIYNAELYNGFINQLRAAGLLPTHNTESQQNNDNEQQVSIRPSFNPTPLSTTPNPLKQ